MTHYFDISLTICSELPRWPGSPPVEFTRRRDMARGDPINDGALSFGVHTGTHVDAPLHELQRGGEVRDCDDWQGGLAGIAERHHRAG